VNAHPADPFSFDLFLSYSSKDKVLVRQIAERLRADGLRIWFDEWELHPGDSIPASIEEGLEHSRVLVLCMSANAFGSEWSRLEAGTFRFRDPLNKERRFIPVRLDEAPVAGSLAQFLYVDWRADLRDREYAKLLDACRPPIKARIAEGETTLEEAAERSIHLDFANFTSDIKGCSFSPDGKKFLTGSYDSTVRVWEVSTGRCLQVLSGHVGPVWSVAWTGNSDRVISGGADKTIRVWEIQTGRCLQVLAEHSLAVDRVAFGDQNHVISGSRDNTLRIWDLMAARCLRVLEHGGPVFAVALSADRHRALSAGSDNTVRLWDVEAGRCVHVLEGHTGWVSQFALSADQQRALSCSDDKTVRLWDLTSGRCLRVFEGHSGAVIAVTWGHDQHRALSGGDDKTLRLWDIETGRCLRVLRGHTEVIDSVNWSADERYALSSDQNGTVRVWNLPKLTPRRRKQPALVAHTSVPEQVQYTNAKVLLVGETSAGKTGLSMRLARGSWQASDSTVGAWATHWRMPLSPDSGVEREIWLWDFGGQADQRLIHQLYMEDTALAVLVFDGQKDDIFETLGQWDRDMTRASRKPFAKLLVAGRIDAGGLRVSREKIEGFAKERGFVHYLETSAKADLGCQELKSAILDGIRWAEIPWRCSPRLFRRLKEEVIRFRDEGRVLMRFNELRDALRLRLAGENASFKDDELKAVLGLLSSPGVVWELAFGNWVLLQPERINAYAQAVIQTLRSDEHERGAIPEERVLNGELLYQSLMERLPAEEERFVLLAMHQTLVERGLCLREHTDTGPLLVFPSYYRRERPELIGHPAVLVSYRFSGFLDDIYSTLVVRMHHTTPFQQDRLWRYAADFKTLSGRHLGIRMSRLSEGAGEMEVYFDTLIPVEEKIIFSRYVHEHLLQKAHDVVRLRHYACPHCGTPVGNREVAMQKLMSGKRDIPCVNCDDAMKRIPLWDEMEQLFADPEIQRRVEELQEQTSRVLDNESKERALVGEVISTVALAGQISREFNVSDRGIDMEIEFKDDAGNATGQRLYLQLKSGDSYIRQRRRDKGELFTIRDQRQAQYWMAQVFPVMLVIRNSEGHVRWMEVRSWLKQISGAGDKLVKHIVFEGEQFDVMSIRRWRDRVLASRG
jgi:WD40 repeat protein